MLEVAMNKKISVIVPAYNVEKYLRRCLDSLVYQTYPYLEILVIDDGSTDGTRGIMGDNISQRIKRRDNVMNLIFNGIKIK